MLPEKLFINIELSYRISSRTLPRQADPILMNIAIESPLRTGQQSLQREAVARLVISHTPRHLSRMRLLLRGQPVENITPVSKDMAKFGYTQDLIQLPGRLARRPERAIKVKSSCDEEIREYRVQFLLSDSRRDKCIRVNVPWLAHHSEEILPIVVQLSLYDFSPIWPLTQRLTQQFFTVFHCLQLFSSYVSVLLHILFQCSRCYWFIWLLY